MAKRRVAARGRWKLAFALSAFVLVMAGVIWRKSVGYTKSIELQALDNERRELEAQRARLQNEIRTAMSLRQLRPVVSARLGMKMPSDSQLIRLPRPVRRGGS
ncbi:MAG: hypothetical protein ABIZ91_17820 [Gemmatimonadaceae bacterium]